MSNGLLGFVLRNLSDPVGSFLKSMRLALARRCAPFGRKGLLLDTKVATCYFTFMLACRLGSLALFDVRISSDVLARVARDYQPNMRIRRRCILQSFRACASALGGEQALAIYVVVGDGDGYPYGLRSCNYSGIVFEGIWARRRPIRNIQTLRNRLVRYDGACRGGGLDRLGDSPITWHRSWSNSGSRTFRGSESGGRARR